MCRVSTVDLIRIRKDILSVAVLGSPYRYFSADVDASGSVSIGDMIRIQRIILSIDQNFADVPEWQFFPANFTFLPTSWVTSSPFSPSAI